MPTFTYKARDLDGRIITGSLHGATQDAVAAELNSQGFTPVRIQLLKKSRTTYFMSSVSSEELIVFSRQLATMIKAGVSFIQCLDTLEAQTGNKYLKHIINTIKAEVEGGAAFSAALEKFPRVFNTLYASMVRVGEEAGVLDEILDRLSTLLEHEALTRQRVKTAVRYPIIVLSAITIAFFFLTAFVIPKFASLYATSRVALPWPTRVLIWLNMAVTDYWWAIFGVAAATVISVVLYIRTPTGRWQLDRLKLHLPLVGPIVRKATMSRFARILSTLYRSGIPLLHGLDVVTGTLGNVIIARAVGTIKESISEGSGLTEPMEKSGVFPPMVTQMVGVGEETGQLDEMLTKVADYFDTEVEYSIRNLATTIEPLLLAVLAAMILFLALGIFLPMWDMIGAMRR